MVREGKKLEMAEAQGKANLPATAEAKGGAALSPSRGGKGTDDDDGDEKGYK
jgi:hypothetical protein